MKKHLLLLLGVLLALPAAARDFDYTYEGQTLTYTVIDEEAKTVSTKAGEYAWPISTPGNKISGDLKIPDKITDGDDVFTVTSIGECAFWGCSDLTSVTIPNSVTYIEYDAFNKCNGLKKAEFASIESLCCIHYGNIYANPFYNAHHLYINGQEVTDLVIPNSVNSIPFAAFCGCSGLTSVTIPHSVDSINTSAFRYCSGLTSVEFPNSVTYIGECAFDGCSGLTSVIIPNSVTTIDEAAFRSCSGLTSVIIPNSVTTIREAAFRSCSGLTSVIIPNSVTTIREAAFRGCSGLTSVYYGTDNPIEANNNIFDEATYTAATLYTTENGAHIARTIDPWKNFVNIEVYDFAGIDEIVVDLNADAPYEVYKLNGVKVGSSTDNLAPGLYIVRQGGKVKKLKILCRAKRL